MKKQTFTTRIKAPKEKVWEVLWGDETYPQWTSAFSEGSIAKTDWKEGSKVEFIDRKSNSGMLARIAEKKEPEVMSFEHYGIIKDGVEDTQSEEVKAWAGARENYYLTQTGEETELKVISDVNEEYEEMFADMWPKALKKLKEISEK
ncbi:SRPBCC domain-containing protein [Mesonia sp. K7]|uniref:SRPBCC domain-containing protein n=1 Tax=Mesonia sp. K7 TaxID=2218606 RepID=UPI000DA8F4C2|nr:SRPBCC domain-containing protein [Mesonia sp. K7]PZD79342.1 SRPBCC domain-containing protein [Mesonia sp. K7]